MRSAVFTLFEGHYHFGAAALINSLYRNKFRGEVYLGYRGELPPWARNAKPLDVSWRDASHFILEESIDIRFLPVNSAVHFTNHKPRFILDVLDQLGVEPDRMFYFDPDIVIKCGWNFFEDWAGHGVALVHESVYNDMPPTHPVRLKWRSIIDECGFQGNRDFSSYLNAGFFGVSSAAIEFLEKFDTFIRLAETKFGCDLSRMISDFGRSHPFNFIDQDAFNMAAMACDSFVSEIGPDGMDFHHGGFVMSHATGAPKPWKKKFVWSAISSGVPPSLADNAYWRFSNSPIANYSRLRALLKKLDRRFAAGIGRIYTRT